MGRPAIAYYPARHSDFFEWDDGDHFSVVCKVCRTRMVLFKVSTKKTGDTQCTSLCFRCEVCAPKDLSDGMKWMPCVIRKCYWKYDPEWGRMLHNEDYEAEEGPFPKRPSEEELKWIKQDLSTPTPTPTPQAPLTSSEEYADKPDEPRA